MPLCTPSLSIVIPSISHPNTRSFIPFPPLRSKCTYRYTKYASTTVFIPPFFLQDSDNLCFVAAQRFNTDILKNPGSFESLYEMMNGAKLEAAPPAEHDIDHPDDFDHSYWPIRLCGLISKDGFIVAVVRTLYYSGFPSYHFVPINWSYTVKGDTVHINVIPESKLDPNTLHLPCIIKKYTTRIGPLRFVSDCLYDIFNPQ